MLTVILLAVVALLITAEWAHVPYPILLVIGGLALGLVPGMPEVELEPELVLLVLLPPLLYAAAFFTPLRELRRNVRPVSLLAIGLVLATMVVVAAVAHYTLGFGWAPAFVLGAIVSPTGDLTAAPFGSARGSSSTPKVQTLVQLRRSGCVNLSLPTRLPP